MITERDGYKIGDEVRLRSLARTAGVGDLNETARIACFLSDIDGGVRLDRPLNGFRCWNVAEIAPAGRAVLDDAKARP